MKKFSKKLFCLMLVAIMVVAAIPFGAFADEATPQDSDEATPQDSVEYKVVVTGDLNTEEPTSNVENKQ